VRYIGKNDDFVLTCTRSGLSVAIVFNILKQLEVDKSYDNIKSIIDHNIKTAEYFAKELKMIYG